MYPLKSLKRLLAELPRPESYGASLSLNSQLRTWQETPPDSHIPPLESRLPASCSFHVDLETFPRLRRLLPVVPDTNLADKNVLISVNLHS